MNLDNLNLLEWDIENKRRCWHFIKKYKYTSHRTGRVSFSLDLIASFLENIFKRLQLELHNPFQISIDEFLPGQGQKYINKFSKTIVINLLNDCVVEHDVKNDVNNNIMKKYDYFVLKKNESLTIDDNKFIICDEYMKLKKRTLILFVRYY